MHKSYKIIAKRLAGEISEDDPEFLQWRQRADENGNWYQSIEKRWDEFAAVTSTDQPDLARGWQKLTQELKPLAQNRTKPVRRFQLAPAFSVAFALTALVLFFLVWHSTQPEMQWLEMTTANAEKRIVVLADGSKVTLNSASRLHYPSTFKSGERACRLEGEAFFEIIQNAHHPFVVQTDNSRITVLGTSYNVCNRDGKTRVIVLDGRVRLQMLVSDKAVILNAGQTSTVVGQNPPTPVQTSTSLAELAWLQNRLYFEKTSLNEVVAELERFYDISIHIENQRFASMTLTGEFTDLSADSAIASICLTLEIHYRKELDIYYLF